MEFRSELQDLQRRARLIFWFARRCTDRVYVLDSGQIVFEGDWSSLQANPDIKQRYLAI